jgi:hypothetical protein
VAETLRHAGYTAAAFTEDAFVAAVVSARLRHVPGGQRNEVQKLGHVQDTFARASTGCTRIATNRSSCSSTYQVHEPYTPPEAYAKLFSPDDGTVDATARALSGRYAGAYDPRFA